MLVNIQRGMKIVGKVFENLTGVRLSAQVSPARSRFRFQEDRSWEMTGDRWSIGVRFIRKARKRYAGRF